MRTILCLLASAFPFIGFASANDYHGRFEGDGSGLTNLSVANVGGITNNQYLPGVPVANGAGFTNISATWTGSKTLLLAAVAAGQYQPIITKFDQNLLATNSLVLWPDGTYGVFIATNINATWLTVDGYTITYTNTGKTIAQPTVIRDNWGNITNSPPLVIAP
jgi:hypothetical protein